jgi:uncharacterized membrane protein YeaQ/YmgE (transglycosylase-associated protein family)
MSGDGLLVILVVGLIAGWLAGQIVRGTGFGMVGDLIIGVVGAFIGGWLLPQLGIQLGTGMVAAVINATLGALVLLWIIKLVRGGGGWDAAGEAGAGGEAGEGAGNHRCVFRGAFACGRATPEQASTEEKPPCCCKVQH